MSRLFRDIVTLAGIPALVALAVLALGAALTHTSAADNAEAIPDQRWPVSDCHTTPLVSVRGASITGGALLCVAPDAVRPSLYASGLAPGGAYGAWMLSFSRPHDGPSDLRVGADILDADRAEAFGRLGGSIASFGGAVHVQGHVEDRLLAHGSQVTLLLIDEGVAGAAGRRPGAVLGYAHFTLP